jgi:uncharacterized protein YjbK
VTLSPAVFFQHSGRCPFFKSRSLPAAEARSGEFPKLLKEIMDFLHQGIFDAILQSPAASEKLKQGVCYTIMRMERRDAKGMLQYYRSAISGTDRSIEFAAQMRREGFDRFEEVIEEFRVRFDDRFLRQA